MAALGLYALVRDTANGLVESIFADPVQLAAAESLAHKIVANDSDQKAFDIARQIAQAQIDLLRIRSTRRLLLNCSLLDHEPAAGRATKSGYIERLVALGRYEQRAFSRHKCAIRRSIWRVEARLRLEG